MGLKLTVTIEKTQNRINIDLYIDNIDCIIDNNTKQQQTTTDMEFVQKFTPPDFQAKNFTPSISPNFNSFSGKKHKK